MTTLAQRIFRASIPAALATVVAVVVMTLWADLQPAFKDGLKNAFSHHWVGKGIISGAVFLLLTIVLSLLQRTNKVDQDHRWISALTWVSVVASAIMSLFFVYETYWK